MDDWGYIPLSRIAHGGYCLRRAALLTNEQLWAESADTAKGRHEHERVHTERVERRGEVLSLYEQTVFSDALCLSGKCDLIEATADPQGCRIEAADFPVRLYPVEFKHGAVRDEPEYEMQLCAQAMCLEEMYGTRIPEGALLYISSHRRKVVPLDEVLRASVREMAARLDVLRRTFELPPAEPGPKCRRCSLREVCMPDVKRSAQAYCRQLEREAREVDAL